MFTSINFYFVNINKVDCKIFPRLLIQRLLDNYRQKWNTAIENSLALDLYKSCKTTLLYENYLDIFQNTTDFYYKNENVSSFTENSNWNVGSK
jgi:hypothetical protein